MDEGQLLISLWELVWFSFLVGVVDLADMHLLDLAAN